MGTGATALAGAALGCNLLIGLERGVPEGSGGSAGATSTSGASTSSSSGAACITSDGGTGDGCDRSWARWAASKPSVYVDNGDGTVTDQTTKLTWLTASGPSLAWQAAKSYCTGLAFAGHCDWRLPTRIELGSLVDYTRTTSPVIDTKFFSAELTGYWTASPLLGQEGQKAWWVNFHDGLVISDGPVTLSLDVRCVR